jgi:aldose 1-epimerase
MNYDPKDIDEYAKVDQYYGKTIGRFAGRIKGATWNNISFKANENGNLLHSGKYGVHNKRFKYFIKETSNFIKVVFSTIDTGKKSLFPGKFNLKVTYKIYKNNKIEIIFNSKCSEDCIVNLTNHAYYCLGSSHLDDLKMKINSSKYVAIDDELLATEIKNVDKVFDFRKFKRVTRDIFDKNLQAATSTGYDHLFLFDSKISAKPQLFLKNNDYMMKIYTDFEAIQFYANCYPQTFINLNNETDGLYKAAALEPQLNTFKIENTLLKANEIRKNRIVYKFDSIKK